MQLTDESLYRLWKTGADCLIHRSDEDIFDDDVCIIIYLILIPVYVSMETFSCRFVSPVSQANMG